MLKVVQSAEAKKPEVAPLACATWMEVPAPRRALVPPVMVRILEPVSERFPRVVVETGDEPFPKRTVLAFRVPQPVPPFDTPRSPVTSVARLT